MRKLTLVLCILIALSSVFASCSAKNEQTLRLCLSTADGSTSADRTPSPWLNRSLATNLMYRALFISDHTLENVKPDLAKSYTVTDSGTKYTVEMKEDLHWSDGEPITAEDVVFSVELARKSVSLNPIYAAAFAHITELHAEGNSVVFLLDTAYRPFIYALAQFAILPEHLLTGADPLALEADQFWLTPVTSGMYAFHELQAGSYFSLIPNPYYEGSAPKIAAVHVSFVTDVQTAALAGEADLVVSNSTETVEALSDDDRFTPYLTDTLFYKYLIFNIRGTDGKENTAMQNVAFRQAVANAFDRVALSKLYPGSTVLVTGDPSYKNVPEYDEESARQAIAASGYDLDRPLRLCYYSSDRTSEDLISTLTHYLESAGLDVEVFLSNDGTRDLFVTREYDIALKGKSAFSVDEWYSEYLSGDALFSAIYGGVSYFDEAIRSLEGAQDNAARSAALEELRTLEEKHMMKTPLFTVGTYVFVGDRVKLPDGVKFGNPSYMTDVNFAEWEVRD